MKNRYYENVRLTEKLINLTSEDINIYDERSGKIVIIPSECDRELPDFDPSLGARSRKVHYVIEKDALLKEINAGRSLDDLAIVCYVSPGRHDVPISYLTWAKRPNKKVVLYGESLYKFSFQCV